MHDERERALAKLESLLAAAPVGIAFVDRDLHYQRVNEALAAITCRPTAAHIGRHVHDIAPELGTVLEPILHQVLTSGQPIVDLELLVGATDTNRSFLANFFPVRLHDTIIGVGAMLIEISERKRMENELRAAVRTREDVLAVVSHDLRSPVSTIQLATTVLMQELSMEPRARKHLEVLHRSIARLQHLLDDLVDSVNIRAGRLSLQLVRQSAEIVMNEAVELQEPLAAERAIQIERAAALAGVEMVCDRHRILQVFGNLLSNALKFCRAGDRITVSGERVGNDIVYAIDDNGPGIATDVIPTLFSPFRSRMRVTNIGTGLGLHICKGIVERHGGRIWIDSSLGRGTTVFFSLPVAA